MSKKAAILIGSLCLLYVLVDADVFKAQDIKAGLEYVAPEDVGWSSQKLEEAKAFAEKINSAAVMVLCDGKVFISWGNIAKKYKVHSIRKPFLSALYGIHVGRGEIDLEATLEEENKKFVFLARRLSECSATEIASTHRQK